jgi:hypothetical protein
VTSAIKQGAGKVPGLLSVLALVPDPRKPRGRRYRLAFVLAVAAACTLAGARTFREIGDQAADLPQEVLRELGGRPHPLRRRILAPSETRIRTLVHAIDADVLDETTETTEVNALLDGVDLRNAVVTADAANSQRETARYIAAPEEDGGRDSDYFLFVKGNQPSMQKAIFGAIQEKAPRPRLQRAGPRARPDHPPLHLGHRRRYETHISNDFGDPVAQRLDGYINSVGPGQVMAGTDCGFGTFTGASLVEADIAWAKLGSLVADARLVTSGTV